MKNNNTYLFFQSSPTQQKLRRRRRPAASRNFFAAAKVDYIFKFRDLPKLLEFKNRFLQDRGDKGAKG